MWALNGFFQARNALILAPSHLAVSTAFKIPPTLAVVFVCTNSAIMFVHTDSAVVNVRAEHTDSTEPWLTLSAVLETLAWDGGVPLL